MREEVEILMKQRDAWKRRCELAKEVIRFAPYVVFIKIIIIAQSVILLFLLGLLMNEFFN